MLCVIQSDPEVPPGLVVVELDRLGVEWRLVRLDLEEPLPLPVSVSAVIVLGGRMSANDDLLFPFLKELKEWIREVVEARSPYLGICLGGQLLAAALGAEVVEQRWHETGTGTVTLTPEGTGDRLFRGCGSEIATFQWHSDSFNIPEGGVLLALSQRCPHQAFRIGNAAWGLQFHPEVTGEIISQWIETDEEKHFLSDWLTGESEYRRTASLIVRNFYRSSLCKSD